MEFGRAGQGKGKADAAALQRLGGGQPGNFRGVIVLAQVRQNQVAGGAVEFKLQEFGQGVVGEVAEAAHHPLLDEPGVGAAAQHLQVVIGFHHQAVAAAQVLFDQRGQEAQVHGQGDLDAFGLEAESDRVGRVVGHEERRHLDVADGEALPGLEVLDARQALPFPQGLAGALGQIDGRTELLGQGGGVAGVVGVLVGEDDAREAIGTQTGFDHAFANGALGEAGVDQQARAGGGEKGGVARRTAAQDGELDRRDPALPVACSGVTGKLRSVNRESPVAAARRSLVLTARLDCRGR